MIDANKIDDDDKLHYKTISDLNECKEKLACTCPGCSCKNTWGGFDCQCKGDLLYIKGQDTCIGKRLCSNMWMHYYLQESY